MASPEGKEDAVTTDDVRGNVDAATGAQQMNYELHVAMKYQRGKTFEVDASIPCKFEKYMKWHYVLGNPTLFNDKRLILKKENELDIAIETIKGDKWLIIDKGTVSKRLTEAEITKSRDLIVHEFLRGADTLMTKSFSTTGVDKKNFAELMKEKIDPTYGHKFWLLIDQEYDLLHCVYQKEMSNIVESVSKEIFTKIQIVKKHLEHTLVFSEVLKSFNVKKQVKDKYKDKVTMAVDCKETTNSCRLTLQGQKSEVESVEKWIQDTYIKAFVFNEMSIGDIKNVSNSHDIERIAKEVFQGFTEVFWYVNSISERIDICSRTSSENDRAVFLLKRCLKKCQYPIKVKQDLEAIPELSDGSACIEGVSENASAICVVGTKRSLQKIDEKLKNDERKGAEKHDDQPKVVKVCFRVDDEADVEVIRRSPEFNSMNGVEIKEILEVKQLGFLLSGPPSMCSDVREKLTQRILENKERMKGAGMQHRDLQNGHVTVQAFSDTAVSEDIDVLVESVAHKKEDAKSCLDVTIVKGKLNEAKITDSDWSVQKVVYHIARSEKQQLTEPRRQVIPGGNLETKVLEGGICFKEVTDQVDGAKPFKERSNTNKAIRDKPKPVHYMEGNLETKVLEGGICFKEVTDQVDGAKPFEERSNTTKALRDKPKPVHYMEGNLETKVLEGGICFKEVTDQVDGAKPFEERSNTNKALRDKPKPVHYMEGTSNLETKILEGGICFKDMTDQVAGAKTFEERSNTNKAMRDKPKPVHYMEGENHVFVSEECTLLIQCGDFWNTQADAIVSTEDIEGSGKGKIAQLIQDRVPPRKQNEYLKAKNSNFSGFVSPGKVYVTSGFDCGYKNVLHAVVPYEIRFESQEKHQDTIKQAVQNVFQQANKNSIYSVVMGLLGASKNTRIDVQIAADAFIQAYQDYVQKSCRRLDITLVCREERVFDIVKEKFTEYELMEVVKETPPPVPRRLHRPKDVPEKIWLSRSNLPR